MSENEKNIFYVDAFKKIMEVTGFCISKEHDGYALHDKAGKSQFECERFNNAAEIIERLDRFHYFDEDYIHYLQDNFVKFEVVTGTKVPEGFELPETAEEWVRLMDIEAYNVFKKEYFSEYMALCYIANADSIAIDMENVIEESNTDVLINEDSPLYVISSYYEDKFRGLEEETKTYDWSKAEEIAHEKLMDGLSVEISEEKNGGCIRIKADDYICDWTEHDLAEFPYKSYDLKKSSNKTISERE